MNIREIRKALGLTLKQFGDLLGIHYLTVLSWENGRYKPKKKYLDAIYELATQNGLTFEPKETVQNDYKPRQDVTTRPYIPPKRAKLYVDDSFLYRGKE